MQKENVRVSPTKDQLKRMLSTHLSCEINRFVHGVELWRQKVKGDSSVDDMVLEACLVHMRLLLYFFFPPQGEEDYSPYQDIAVSDYIPDDQCPLRLRLLLFPTPDWVPVYKSRLDRQIVRLTLERGERDTEYDWHHWKDIQGPLSQMEKLIEAFLQALPYEMKVRFNPMRGWRD